MINITSRDNKILKHTRKLASASNRAKFGEFIAEGERLCREALMYAEVAENGYVRGEISYAILTDKFAAENPNFQKRLDDSGITIYTVTEKLFESVSATEAPQGVLLVLRIPEPTTPDFSSVSRVLILDGLNEPGNMGTIIRTADAFGFKTIVTVNNCVDVYNPKVVRASMGGIFRVRFVVPLREGDVSEADRGSLRENTSHRHFVPPPSKREAENQLVATLKSAGFQIAATALENSVDINNFEFGEKVALIIGSEANGVSAELLAVCDSRVKIPMSDGSESLNAAVAAGIAMWVVGA